ncbi:hypothetical protein BV25DRAFT_350359 [Artomyces pyxidatus]|uniref:Uncharacterized protein n=1 Tax=Artomyces pyxidatus TaxID=48021 RepID=A0ACB8T5X7_9AGAM|nr:hypothetical protein BV25DRAFT_350359 [Artomyces pyxidatus]
MAYRSILLDDSKTQLAFIDSGVPSQESAVPYTTIFAFHGLGYASPTFKRIHEHASRFNLRFVSVNRRGYVGSTPLTASELAIPTSGSGAEKTAFFNARGIEAAIFVDKFVQQNNIPPISSNGRAGGIGLLGWSAGNGVTLSIVANLDVLPSETQARFTSHLRGVIMHHPPTVVLGLPSPKELWLPMSDPQIPAHLQSAMFTVWVSSYFKHGDLSTRNRQALSWVVPSVTRAPSIYNMSQDEIAETVDESVPEGLLFTHGALQEHAIYRKACFDHAVRALVPSMKITHLCGDQAVAAGVAAFFSVQEDVEEEGGSMVEFNLVPGANLLVSPVALNCSLCDVLSS